jgi:hypothetical protein
VRRTHTFTAEEKLELDAIIAMSKESATLYELSVCALDRAISAVERGDLLESNNLRVQSLNYELRALDLKIKLLDRYQKFLEDISRAEGWTMRKEARNGRTG